MYYLINLIDKVLTGKTNSIILNTYTCKYRKYHPCLDTGVYTYMHGLKSPAIFTAENITLHLIGPLNLTIDLIGLLSLDTVAPEIDF